MSSVFPPSNDDVGGCANPVFLFLMQYNTVSTVNKTVEMIPKAWGRNNKSSYLAPGYKSWFSADHEHKA